MKKIKFVAILVFIMCFLLTGINNIQAIEIGVATPDKVVDSEYGWSFSFINGVTTTTSSGMTNYYEDQYMKNSIELYTRSTNDWYSVRLTSNSQKGNVWVRYNNVGVYNGQIVDLKVTLSGWNYLQPANTAASADIKGVNYPTIFFSKKKIDVEITNTPAIDSPVFTYEFLKHGTNTPISVKCHESFIDIDGGEFFTPTSGFDAIYITEDSNLTATESRVICENRTLYSDNADRENWATCLISGTGFKMTYTAVHFIKGNEYRDITQTASANSRGSFHYLISEVSLLPFDIATPTKSVTKSEVYAQDSFAYNISHFVPAEHTDYYYSRYVLTDNVPNCLNVNQIKVYDQTGADRTSWFTTSTDANNKVTITGNNLSNSAFYNKTYRFEITCSKKANYDMSSWYNGTVCRVSNQASIYVEGPTNSSTRKITRNSNTVNVDFYFKITTGITNGTITSTMSKVPAGSTKTVTFAPNKGYYISSIKVNGSAISLSGYNVYGSNTYTFSNVRADNTIEVVCQPKKSKITIQKQDAETKATPQGDATFSGAIYTIYKDSNCTDRYATVTLDANGRGSTGELLLVEKVNGSDVYYEKLYLKETRAPVGYNLDTQVYVITQNLNSLNTAVNSLTITVQDEVIKNNIEITKYLDKTSSTTKQKLSGAVFKAVLKSNPSKVYYSTATDANGYCIIRDLPYGTYTITESTIPSLAYNGEFFIGSSTTRQNSFEQFIQVDNSVNSPYKYTDITDVPKKMQITIYKEDYETGVTTQGDAHLEGAEYTLYRDAACTDVIETVTIQKQSNGKYSATSSWFLVGTYYIKETKAPVGYLLDPTVYTIKQDPSKQTSEYSNHEIYITSKEEVIRNSIEITKYLEATDSTEKQPLAGAVFSATLNSDPSKVYYSTATDANGYCIIRDLPYGRYTIRESTIPPTAYNGELYVENSTTRSTSFEQFIEIDSSTREPYKYTNITDVAEKMQIIVYKEDYETGTITQGDAHLEGAEYTLYRDKTCTDAIETIKIEKQENGKYSATSGWYLVGTYYVKETKAPEGYLIDNKVYTVSQDPTAQTTEHTTHTITSKDEVIRNDIEITKYLEATDSTDKQSLAGAVFSATLNSDPSKVYYSTTTNANGYCIIRELPYGTYTIRETTLPDVAYNREFYIGNSTTRVTSFEQFIEVDNSTNDPYVWSDITDVAEKMQITIYKEDIETGSTTQGDAHLEGAEYTLYRDAKCTNPIETITIEKQTDGRYSATSGWYLVGTYYVKETKAPEGYLIDNKVYTISQDPAAQTLEYTTHTITSKDEVIRNDIEITKYLEATDSTDKQSLEGAVFSATLNSDTSKVYYSTVTDENGYCIITELPYGTYTIRESTLPDVAYNREFYVGNSTTRVKTFEQFIEVDNSTNDPYVWSDITDVAEKMQITIYKEDIETGSTTQGDAHLEGAEYTLYRDAACTDAIETITIEKQADGRYSATSGWYLVGTYYAKETKAPEGYLIDERVYTISQNPETQTEEHTYHSITSRDEVIRNDIEITKYLEATDSTDKQSLAGAVFSATLNSDTSKVYYSTVTDNNGYCIITELPYGTYTLRESTIPATAYNGEFYIGNSTTRVTSFEQFIEVDNSTNDPYVWSDITDVAKKMRIIVTKEDDETGSHTQGDAHLEGAEYTIYRNEECTDVVETITTIKNSDGTYTATSSWFLVGKYWVKETKAPEGYNIDENIYPIEQIPATQVNEHSTHHILSKDKVMEGIVRITKFNNNSTSTDKNPAEGAVLRLSLDSDPSVYYDAVVDKYGYAEFVEEDCRETCYPYTIPYGLYTISEIQTSNSGKNIYINKQKTQITHQEQTQRYILTDEYVRLRLTVKKIDSETGKIIPANGTFKIWDVTNQEWYEEMVYPSGEYISEFTTNNQGQLTLNRHLEAGGYVLYEIQAPYGYYLDDSLRIGATGYEFNIGVKSESEVVVYHEDEETILEYTEEKYDNIPTKMYHYTALIEDPAQKAIIKITDIAKQFTSTDINNGEYGKVNTPIFDEKGLEGAEFDIIAVQDIYTPDGTKRYSKGEVVSHVKTNENGEANSTEIYLGKYQIVQTVSPKGYILDKTVIDVTIEYTNQYEKVQIIPIQIKQELQNVSFSFDKIFKELEVSKFKFEEQKAIFGIYTRETIRNYKGENTIGIDELVEVIETNEKNKVSSKIQLPEGKYYVKELYVTNPYTELNDQFNFEVEYTDSSDRKIEVTINNGEVENEADVIGLEFIVYPDVIYEQYDISKIKDQERLEELAKEYGVSGKTYKVFHDKECTKPVITIDDEEATFDTDLNGTILIPDMPIGTYYFKEIIAPYGFELSDEVIEVKLDGKKELVIITASEPLIKAKLLEKRDTFTNDVIEGCVFEITDEEENVIYTGVTNESGIVEIPVIYFENEGTYYYQEIEAPDMYQVNEEKQEFVATYDEETCEWTLELIEVGNDRKTIEELVIIKLDEKTEELLKGCEFTIVLLDEEGKEYVNAEGETIYLVKKGITDENGEYVVENVPYGRYKFKETKAPEGYVINEKTAEFTIEIDENSTETVIYEITNEAERIEPPATGDIQVYALAGILGLSLLGIMKIVVRKRVNN